MIIKKFRFAYIIVVLAVIYYPVLSFSDSEIRKITPPKLDSAHLGKEILCHRPMRHGFPNMSVENRDGKIIAHNYGHGGGGWTLGPGAVGYVNNLLTSSKDAADLKKDTSITIIGAGALGLFNSLRSREKRF